MTGVETDLLDRIRIRLTARAVEATPAEVAAALWSEGRLVGDAAVLEVVEALRLDSVGAGPLEPLLRLPGVTDVLVNGPGEVYVAQGAGLRRTKVVFADDAAVRRLAQRLAAAAGRRLDDSVPFVDVRLRDGTRLHAALAPVSGPGTCLSLRVPARAVLTMEDLIEAGSMSRAAADLVRTVVRCGASFVISGGTGSGKTTMLAALLSQADPDSRIVVVEDSSELRLRHPHVVSLEARPANVEGQGEISLRDLVRQALRMRPDRLVIGEVRGAEVVDMLAALNTGHEGGCCTVHANSAADVPTRLEALGAAAGMPRNAVHAQMAAALQVVLHLRQGRDGVRRLTEVAVISRGRDGLVESVPALTFTGSGETMSGVGAARLEQLIDEFGGR